MRTQHLAYTESCVHSVLRTQHHVPQFHVHTALCTHSAMHIQSHVHTGSCAHIIMHTQNHEHTASCVMGAHSHRKHTRLTVTHTHSLILTHSRTLMPTFRAAPQAVSQTRGAPLWCAVTRPVHYSWQSNLLLVNSPQQPPPLPTPGLPSGSKWSLCTAALPAGVPVFSGQPCTQSNAVFI